MKNIMLTGVVLVVISGTAIATAATKEIFGDKSIVIPISNKNENVDKNVSFSFEQTVEGNGFYMTYKYSKMGILNSKTTPIDLGLASETQLDGLCRLNIGVGYPLDSPERLRLQRSQWRCGFIALRQVVVPLKMNAL